MRDPLGRPITVTVVLVFDAEEDGTLDAAIDSVWTFSSRLVADVWVERRTSLDPTLGYATFEVEIDQGISEIPVADG